MRTLALILISPIALGGCSVVTERSSLGYGDYVALSCDQLGEEALYLIRQIGDRSEHLVVDDQKRKERAKRQLVLVKQASAANGCDV